MAGLSDELQGYHAHIYYNNDSFNNTKSIAEKLRDTLGANFPVEIGKFSGIAGPHPVPQIQIIFKKEAFQSVVSWLMLNRQGLDILIHPLTDDEYRTIPPMRSGWDGLSGCISVHCHTLAIALNCCRLPERSQGDERKRLIWLGLEKAASLLPSHPNTQQGYPWNRTTWSARCWPWTMLAAVTCSCDTKIHQVA